MRTIKSKITWQTPDGLHFKTEEDAIEHCAIAQVEQLKGQGYTEESEICSHCRYLWTEILEENKKDEVSYRCIFNKDFSPAISLTGTCKKYMDRRNE